jgi:hypothetical protein
MLKASAEGVKAKEFDFVTASDMPKIHQLALRIACQDTRPLK